MMLRRLAFCPAMYLALWWVPTHALDMTSPQPSPYSCRIDELPTSWAFDNSPGEIEQNNAVFGELGQTTIDFHFRNREPSAIQALMLVMEYADGQGRIIDQVPVSAAVGDKTLDSSPNVLAPIQSWKRAVLPGASALMGAVKEGIRTGSCPVRARVTFARAQFTDGTVRTFSSPQWRVGPMPRAIPTLLEPIPPVPVDPPISLRARVKISATGQVADILSDDRDQPDRSFRPALLNGEATDSEFDALFLIHAKGEIHFHESEPLLAPVTLIQFFWIHDLQPDSGGADRMTVMYGFLPECSQVE